MRHRTRLAGVLCTVLAAAGCQTLSAPAATQCSPLGYDKAALMTLKANEFRIDDAQQRQRFALELVACLSDPDPQLRDGVAYEALAGLMRGKQLDAGTVRQLRVALLESLGADNDDPTGFRQPFAALALAEVARVDRLDDIFSNREREELIEGATAYMAGITDYRGFHESEGWRHGVAHTADLLLQLALNPALTTEQLEEIASAIAVQVAPAGSHFYVYGEYERLARPVYYLAMRGELSEQYWADWFAQLASPAPFDGWNAVWTSQAGLAKMHNTKVFAATVYVYASANEGAAFKPLAEGALAILSALN